ncbi:hypothetical protein [Sodalis-like endosymbiont of Proechinophthirus fluctus]|uniref:hypothetical protein n=1 Tax=Sodalis-like endosymbiont of Proechinophthirus fluctus TaxID=1462730 RepID=UPI003F74EDDE
MGPRDQFTRSTPNSWGLHRDPKLSLVPACNETPDYFGGRCRTFDDQYSSSTIALDIETSEPRWRFQNVHH